MNAMGGGLEIPLVVNAIKTSITKFFKKETHPPIHAKNANLNVSNAVPTITALSVLELQVQIILEYLLCNVIADKGNMQILILDLTAMIAKVSANNALSRQEYVNYANIQIDNLLYVIV